MEGSGGRIGRRDKRRGECEMTGVGQGEESQEGVDAGRALTLSLKLHALITQQTLMGKGTARKWLEREVHKGLDREWSKLEYSCKCSLEMS